MHAYDLIQEKIQYNQWANTSLVDWLSEQPKASFLRR